MKNWLQSPLVVPIVGVLLEVVTVAALVVNKVEIHQGVAVAFTEAALLVALEAVRRLETVDGRLETLLTEQTATLNRIALFERTVEPWRRFVEEDDPWLNEWMQIVGASYLKAKRVTNNGIVQDNLKRLMERHREAVQQYAAGRIEISSRPPNWFGDHLDRAQREVLATSLVDPKHYWLTPEGQQYLLDHRAAKEKGVNICRVFIEHRNQMPKLESIVTQHCLEHLDVKVAACEDTPQDLQRDYMIVDGEILIQLTPDRNGDLQLLTVRVGHDADEEIKEYKARFWSLWNGPAKPPPEFGLPCPDRSSS